MIGMLVTANVSVLNKRKFEIWTGYQYPDMNDKFISNWSNERTTEPFQQHHVYWYSMVDFRSKLAIILWSVRCVVQTACPWHITEDRSEDVFGNPMMLSVFGNSGIGMQTKLSCQGIKYKIVFFVWPFWCLLPFLLSYDVPSPSLTWNLKMMVSKRNLLFQDAIFRFHVKL